MKLRQLAAILFTCLSLIQNAGAADVKKFDIKGVRLGMTVEEVKKALPDADITRYDSPAGYYSHSLESKTKEEKFEVSFSSSLLGAKVDRVNKIVLSQVIPEISVEGIADKLQEKYGPPDQAVTVYNMYSNIKGIILYGYKAPVRGNSTNDPRFHKGSGLDQVIMTVTLDSSRMEMALEDNPTLKVNLKAIQEIQKKSVQEKNKAAASGIKF